MGKKLNEAEWKELEGQFRAHLNTFDPDHPLPDDYFYDHEVWMDEVVMEYYRYLVVELIPDDEGGSSILYVHTDAANIGQIEFAAWTFDTATVVWKADVNQGHSFDTGGWNTGNHPGGS